MNKTHRALLAKKAEQVKAARAVTDIAAGANRDLTEDESKAFDALSAQIASTSAAIDREQLLANEERTIEIPGATIIESRVNIADDPKRGFKSFGEFSQSVCGASAHNARPDERLLIGAVAPTTFGSEGTGQDGGFAVPPEYSREIYTLSLTDEALLPLTDEVTVSGNSMVFPKDETTPWGTDGVRAYWQNEATLGTQTKPKIGTTMQRLHKLMALVPLTDELIEDTNALDSYLPSKIADSIRWKTNEAILFGNGNGQPLGAFNSDAAIVVVKEAAQATLTLQAMNLVKMVARLPGGSFPRAVWLVNNDVLPALFTLTLGNYPIYLPMNAGIQGSPYGTLLGRPVMVNQHAKSFSAQGDVLLLDPKWYRTITKANGVQSATSIHIYFDAAATAFRTTFRVDGQSKIAAAITPANGSNTLSPFIQLGAR